MRKPWLIAASWRFENISINFPCPPLKIRSLYKGQKLSLFFKDEDQNCIFSEVSLRDNSSRMMYRGPPCHPMHACVPLSAVHCSFKLRSLQREHFPSRYRNCRFFLEIHQESRYQTRSPDICFFREIYSLRPERDPLHNIFLLVLDKQIRPFSCVWPRRRGCASVIKWHAISRQLLQSVRLQHELQLKIVATLGLPLSLPHWPCHWHWQSSDSESETPASRLMHHGPCWPPTCRANTCDHGAHVTTV